MVDSPSHPRSITVLGATGSVGTSTLDVIQADRERFRVEAVTANSDVEKLSRIAVEADARLAVICNPELLGALRQALSGTGIEVAAGQAAVVEAAQRPVDIVVAAIIGAAGLRPTHAAVAQGHTVALANKECLVSAGQVFSQTRKASGGDLLPVDSEHNAIFQILEGRSMAEVTRIILTASGGPFRQSSQETMAAATPAEALNHPNWSMGPKITIDSATLMNKGLEVIEAHHIFSVEPERLDVLVHPESVIHGLVEFQDGAQIAALGAADMRLPIAHCLAWPRRAASAHGTLDLASCGKLSFEALDVDHFPAFRIAMEALEAGGWATNVMSAANEIAVGAFLQGRIGFLEIAGLVGDTLDQASGGAGLRTPTTIDEAIEIDSYGRELATALMEARSAA